MLYDPKAHTLSFIDEPAINVKVDPKEEFATLLEIVRDGGEVDAALRAAAAKLRRTNEAVPARQITRGAEIGFEFQELRSKAEVTKPPAAEADDDDGDGDDNVAFDRGDQDQIRYERALMRLPERIPVTLYGADGRWYVVNDGDNLEFVNSAVRESSRSSRDDGRGPICRPRLRRIGAGIGLYPRRDGGDDHRTRRHGAAPGQYRYSARHAAQLHHGSGRRRNQGGAFRRGGRVLESREDRRRAGHHR